MRKQVNSFVINPKQGKVETTQLRNPTQESYLRMKCPLCDTKRTKPCRHTAT